MLFNYPHVRSFKTFHCQSNGLAELALSIEVGYLGSRHEVYWHEPEGFLKECKSSCLSKCEQMFVQNMLFEFG